MINPQYKVVVQPIKGKQAGSGVVRVALHGEKECPWNVKLLWGNGQRVFEYDTAL